MNCFIQSFADVDLVRNGERSVILSPCICLQKDQLNLQSVDIVSLKESLRVEQQRCRQLWEDRETVVTRLHSQVRQLQQGRDDYYTKNQELQVDA